MKRPDYRTLQALDAVIRERGFERAAQKLCITQSAVSQRIKQLENMFGQPLLVRTVPPRPTEQGQKLLALLRQVELLEEEWLGDEQTGSTPLLLSLAVNADSLATWLLPALAPVLAHVLGPVIIPVYEILGANPSMFAGTLLACDMGGFFLAKELAGGDVAAWLYSGLILGSMMGPTIVFSIPVALGIIEPSDRRYLALGVLAGIVTIPIGCIAGGLIAMYSGVQINGQPVEFTFALILMNMIPVLIVAVLVALGLKFIPEKMINGFQIFAKFLVALITIGLAAAVVKFLLGWELIPGLDPIFMAPGDKPGEVMRAIEVIGSISCVLLGAYPMVLLLTRWFEKPLMNVGKLLNVNNIAAAGMVATLANNIPMFGMMKQMDTRGKVINCAFAVSAAFALGDHLGFAAANMNAMIFPMIVGKLIGGVTAIGVAMMLVPKDDAAQVKTEAEAQS
ncbi:ethanolamine utilization protein EutH [Salmonella enterica subsp. enterica serovar Dublin]|nr:ethanolamine utilization protein EutH [Salmonella enterica subsp. enterica serovar Dublin]